MSAAAPASATLAMVHDDHPVGDLEREGEILLDNQQSPACGLGLAQERRHALDIFLLHAFARLVEQKQPPGFGDAAHEGEDFPFAAAQRSADCAMRAWSIGKAEKYGA